MSDEERQPIEGQQQAREEGSADSGRLSDTFVSARQAFGRSFERLTAVAADFCVSAQRREAYGGRARAYALEHHTVDRSAGELKALLRSLLR